MEDKEIPLDEQSPIVASTPFNQLFGKYLPAYSNNNGHLELDLSENKQEVYESIRNKEEIDLAKGSSGCVSYSVYTNSHPIKRPLDDEEAYEVRLEIFNSSLPLIGSFKSFDFFRSLNKFLDDTENLEKKEQEMGDKISERMDQATGKRGKFLDVGPYHLDYMRPFYSPDEASDEKIENILEEAGDLTTEAFRYYSDLSEKFSLNLPQDQNQDLDQDKPSESRNKHRATSIFRF